MNDITQAHGSAPASIGLQDFDSIPLPDIPTNIRVCEQNIKLNGWMLGGMLASAKKRVPHGQFMTWLQEHTDISQTTANDLMALYEGVRQTPFLGEMKQSAAIALLALPADDRERFAQENDAEALSVRQLKEAIKAEQERREAAERAAEEADQEAIQARQEAQRVQAALEEAQRKREEAERIEAIATKQANRASENLAKLNETYYQSQQTIAHLEASLADATKPEAIKVEVPVEKRVVVAPDDYDDLKAQAQAGSAELTAAQDYAIQMERKAQEAQAELRRLRDTATQEGRGGGFELPSFQSMVGDFMGRVALFPKMGASMGRINTADAVAYERCIDLVAEWCEQSRAMLADANRFYIIDEEIIREG